MFVFGLFSGTSFEDTRSLYYSIEIYSERNPPKLIHLNRHILTANNLKLVCNIILKSEKNVKFI